MYSFHSIVRGVGISLCATLLTSRAAVAAPAQSAPSGPPRVLQSVPGDDVVVRPESERYLDMLIMGLNAPDNNYFLLPDLREHEEPLGGDVERIRKDLYLLDFELSHGRLMQVLPEYTALYVAIPSLDPQSLVSKRAREWFKEYLLKRAGWSATRVSKQVFFFNSPAPILWARDITKIVGFDRKGRAILGTAADQSSDQLQALTALRDAFPDKFVLRTYAPNVPDVSPKVTVEGGDLEIVVAPSGQVELLVGRHRALRFLHRAGLAPAGATEAVEYGLSNKDIAIARNAYSQSFFNLPVTFVPESLLRDPSRGSQELFHLDMIVTVLPSSQNTPPRAFVPTYLYNPVDAYRREPLSPSLVEAAQREYDLVAAQFTDQGYQVYRLPFADHPVRSPVNIGKYLDRTTGKHTVLMSKYPYHIVSGDRESPQERFVRLYRELGQVGDSFKTTHSEQDAKKLVELLEGMWEHMDKLASEPNPIFDLQRSLMQQLGYDVKTVPDYTYGAGGIHCKILQ